MSASANVGIFNYFIFYTLRLKLYVTLSYAEKIKKYSDTDSMLCSVQETALWSRLREMPPSS